ncbi:hypothetical protein HYPSUDRAFT_130586, partial [Hypholoma sublateritium FD-334 SS-4]
LFGFMANWALMGILWVQVYLYYTAFPKDRHILKLVVFVQFLLENIQTVTLTHDNIQYISMAYVSLAGFNEIGTLWISIALMTGLIASITQGFYCYRVGVLTRSRYAVAVISLVRAVGQII